MKNLQKHLDRNRKYLAAPGAPYDNDDAQVIGRELDRLEHNGVPVTPDNVVSVATDADSPLHKFFTWDNVQAADNWRKSEARGLISHLLVIIEKDEGEPVALKARISVTTHNAEHHAAAPEYVSVCAVLNSPAMRSQVLHQAQQELKSWAEKYERLGITELQPIFRSVENWVK